MKHIACVTAFIVISAGCFCSPVDPDPFEPDLERYYIQREAGSSILFWSVLSLAAGFIGGSTCSTMNSLGYMDPAAADPCVITSYCIVSVSAIVGFIGFLVWKDGSEKYIDTLRLQSQYYNLVY